MSVETVDKGISYLILVYVTSSTVVSYSPELLQGAAFTNQPWMTMSPTEEFSVFLTKIVLPVCTGDQIVKEKTMNLPDRDATLLSVWKNVQQPNPAVQDTILTALPSAVCELLS